MQHLNQGRTRKISPQVGSKQSTTFLNLPEGSSTLQSHQELYKTCHNRAKAAENCPEPAITI